MAQFKPDINTSFLLTSWFVLLEILSQSHIFCLKNTMMVPTITFLISLCKSYWTPSRRISDETCGSCITVSHAIFFSPPEITLRLPTLGDGHESRNEYPAQVLRKTWMSLITFFREISRMWCTLQLWIFKRNCCSAFKMAVPRTVSFLASLAGPSIRASSSRKYVAPQGQNSGYLPLTWFNTINIYHYYHRGKKAHSGSPVWLQKSTLHDRSSS
jgi:hypothetical protein